MPGTYEEWQMLLAETFLQPHDGPTVFFLDDSELARLRPESGNAATDLADAVLSRIRIADGRSMFNPVMVACRQWAREGRPGPPPVLPVIAITVLAATRMHSDSQARSTNYYLRLAQALLPGRAGSEVDALRTDLREAGAFVDVVEMWQNLHAWIEDQQGRAGLSTIRDHPHLARIGYALSQALVRQSDRIALTRFFHALGFPAGNPPEAPAILRALRIWTASLQNQLGDSFMRALADPDTGPLLGSVIEAHARAWDGRVLTSDGRLRIAMRLSVDLDAWQARWLFPVPPDGPQALRLSGTGEQPISLAAEPGLAYYSAEDVPRVTPEAVSLGLRLQGGEYTAEFPATPAVFLRPDPETGAWSSAPGILPFEEHLVLIAGAHSADFAEALRSAAADGWSQIPQRRAPLLPGYALFRGVRFTNGEELDGALARLPGLRRIGVAPMAVPRARFVRGLPLATSLSGSHYLTGGAPDLLLPSDPEPRTATVILDGLREELQANGFPLELRRFATGAGPHTVNADGQELRFTTLSEGPDPAVPAGTGALGWSADGQMSGPERPHAITGALVSVSGGQTVPVLARRGREQTWILHDDGRAQRISEPAPSRLLSASGIHSPCFEISAPPGARWLAQLRGERWTLTGIGTPEQSEYQLRIDVIAAWKRACADANGSQLWNMQLNLAKDAS